MQQQICNQIKIIETATHSLPPVAHKQVCLCLPVGVYGQTGKAIMSRQDASYSSVLEAYRVPQRKEN